MGVAHPLVALVFVLLGSAFLGGLGIVAAIFANKFDQMAAITNFVITPLAFLSGTFYSIERLPGLMQALTHVNPVFYLIDGVRYGVIGTFGHLAYARGGGLPRSHRSGPDALLVVVPPRIPAEALSVPRSSTRSPPSSSSPSSRRPPSTSWPASRPPRVLVSRAATIPALLLTGRPYGLWRDAVLNRTGARAGGRLAFLVADTIAFLTFQMPVYAAVLALAGAAPAQIARALVAATLAMLLLSRPFGAFLDWLRGQAGVTPQQPL